VESGALNADDERFATLFALGSLNAVRRWYRPEGRLSADQVAEMMADAVFSGLLRR
jgi:TetR/AcrR family transcriptional regulator, cholesterol catabolism regulator